MAWAKSKVFLEKVQLFSIVLYLVCLGGYAIGNEVPSVYAFCEGLRADILGFTFFSLFIASTILLSLEKGQGAQQTSKE